MRRIEKAAVRRSSKVPVRQQRPPGLMMPGSRTLPSQYVIIAVQIDGSREDACHLFTDVLADRGRRSSRRNASVERVPQSSLPSRSLDLLPICAFELT